MAGKRALDPFEEAEGDQVWNQDLGSRRVQPSQVETEKESNARR